MIERDTLKKKEWKDLDHTTKLIYIYLKSHFNGFNNGKIPFKYNDYKDEFSPATIAKSLKELQDKGWIEKTKYGGLYRYYCLYRLTGRYDQIREPNRR